MSLLKEVSESLRLAAEWGTSNIEVADEILRDSRREGVNERFLILARDAGPMAEGLRKVLEPLGRVEVVVDRWDDAATGSGAEDRGDSPFNDDSEASTVADRCYIHIPDGEVTGYEGLMGRASDLPQITAWL